MAIPLLRTDKEIAEIYQRHKNTVYRVSFAYMKNAADTEDIVQETFCRLIKAGTPFENEEHEKAWLIRTATNLCKNVLRHWWRKRRDWEACQHLHGNDNIVFDEVLSVVMDLPAKYKAVVYLYYYEGYNSVEIARILLKPQSTIRNHLHEARNLLRERLGGDFNEE